MSWRYLTVVALTLCIGIPASGASQRHKSHKKKAKPVEVQPQPAALQPEAPQPPPTPEHGPSSPPEVTLQGGRLTIIARNSTLSDVLIAVRSKTGASVDMPPASNERVAGQFGPGAPRDVMAQLLNGSHYDYVLVGSPADPAALKKVVLTIRSNLPAPAQQASSTTPAYNQGFQPQQVSTDQQDQPTEDATSDTQNEPPAQEQEEPQGEQPPQQNPGGNPMVKTPEQLLRELQQQQQQQQQQNQGQPPQ